MVSVVWTARTLHQTLWSPGVQPKCVEIPCRTRLRTSFRISSEILTPAIALSSPSDVAETDNRKTGSGTSGGRSSQPRFERVRGRSGLKSPPRKVTEMARDEKLDTFGRLRTPRAAREMALCILYAAMLRDIPPLQVYEERLNQRIGRDFDREILETYEHTPVDVGDNESEEDEAKAIELMQQQEMDADLEAAVLTAPLPLVYSRFALNFMRNIVKVTAEQWKKGELRILELFPLKWKKDPKYSMIPYCILQMAVAEIENLETSPRVVINEAIDLTKKFCDGASPRIVNGILGRYMQNREEPPVKDTSKFTYRVKRMETKKTILQPENTTAECSEKQ